MVRSMVALDRVQERRRAVALARHYRDEEGLSIAEIARRLGRAEATVKAYLCPLRLTKDPRIPHAIRQLRRGAPSTAPTGGTRSAGLS